MLMTDYIHVRLAVKVTLGETLMTAETKRLQQHVLHRGFSLDHTIEILPWLIVYSGLKIYARIHHELLQNDAYLYNLYSLKNSVPT